MSVRQEMLKKTLSQNFDRTQHSALDDRWYVADLLQDVFAVYGRSSAEFTHHDVAINGEEETKQTSTSENNTMEKN